MSDVNRILSRIESGDPSAAGGHPIVNSAVILVGSHCLLLDFYIQQVLHVSSFDLARGFSRLYVERWSVVER